MTRAKKSSVPDLSQRVSLTVGLIERLRCPESKGQAFLRDLHAPSLKVRVTRAGAKSFVFEAKLRGETIRKTIGDVRSWSIEDARAEARRLSVMVDTGNDPREVERAAKAEKEAHKKANERAKNYTLEHLLNDYTAYLEQQGKPSAQDARSIFKTHVLSSWTSEKTTAASLITSKDVAAFMRRVMEQGKHRTANKLRSYMLAAYSLAVASHTKPSIPLRFTEYGIKTNPVEETAPDERANSADKNPLSLEELRAYWKTIKDRQDFKGAVLRLHMLTGGQRIEQLVSLQTVNVKDDHITIFDSKGRPGKPPRPHTLPLLPLAKVAMKAIQPRGVFALSSDGGKTQLSATTLSRWAQEVAPPEIPKFQTKRIRSGVETALAAARIPKDTRGRLQSHGVAGVQERHYDGHDYMDEKRHALETLVKLLEAEESAKVVPLRAASASR